MNLIHPQYTRLSKKLLLINEWLVFVTSLNAGAFMTHWYCHRHPIRIPRFLLTAWRAWANALSWTIIHNYCTDRGGNYSLTLNSSFHFRKMCKWTPTLLKRICENHICGPVWVPHMYNHTHRLLNGDSGVRTNISDIGVLLKIIADLILWYPLSTRVIICHWHKIKQLNITLIYDKSKCMIYAC